MNKNNPNKNFIEWCFEKHRETNHYYDHQTLYQFHLGMVINAAIEFEHVWNDVSPKNQNIQFWVIECGCAGHDLIEDARVTYNDILQKSAEEFPILTHTIIPEIIFACTNEKGRNRKERQSDKYYELIKATPGALFVKLCDRIANLKYSKMMQNPKTQKSSMFEKYKKEYSEFASKLYDRNYDEMFAYMEKLFV